MVIRALKPPDLEAAGRATADSLGIEIDDPAAARRWRERLAHLLGTDPSGSFVAERDGEIVGAAQAMVRERLWCLSLLAVRPEIQSSGAGSALIDRALSYGTGARAGMIVSSNDPRALRLYALRGFSLRPALQADGSLRRAALPRQDPAVRDGDLGDLEALEPIAREIRGAASTTELRFALGRGARLIRYGERGFAVAQPGRGVWLLIARDEVAARALLWSALALTGEGDDQPLVRWITAGQDWAVEICLKAGLHLQAYGALCVRGDPGPLRPFIPSAPFA